MSPESLCGEASGAHGLYAQLSDSSTHPGICPVEYTGYLTAHTGYLAAIDGWSSHDYWLFTTLLTPRVWAALHSNAGFRSLGDCGSPRV